MFLDDVMLKTMFQYKQGDTKDDMLIDIEWGEFRWCSTLKAVQRGHSFFNIVIATNDDISSIQDD